MSSMLTRFKFLCEPLETEYYKHLFIINFIRAENTLFRATACL